MLKKIVKVLRLKMNDVKATFEHVKAGNEQQ